MPSVVKRGASSPRFSQSMLPVLVLVILAVSSCVAAAEPVTLQLSTSFDESSALLNRGELRAGDFRLALAGRFDALLSRPDASFLAGLSSPWLRAGPLSPAGLLREASNPLGFGAGSDVFVERTAFVLDESFPGPPAGILLMPVARSLGVFCRPLAGGGEWIGCMASAFHRPGVSMEGFLSMSDPSAQPAPEEWTSPRAVFPGGRILSSAGRLLMETGPFGLAATLGASKGELVPPGAFFHFHAAVRTGILGVHFLLGSAEGTYTAPTGEHPAEAVVASTAILLSSPRGTVDLRVSQATSQPAFSPHPFRATRSEASFEVERTVAAPGEILLRAVIRGGTIIHDDVQGARSRFSRCSALAGARMAPFRLEAGAGWNATEGASILTTGEATLDRRGSRAGFEGSLSHLDGDARTFSGLLSFRLERRDIRLSVSAGVADLRLRGPAADVSRALRFSVGWNMRESLEWGSPPP